MADEEMWGGQLVPKPEDQPEDNPEVLSPDEAAALDAGLEQAVLPDDEDSSADAGTTDDPQPDTTETSEENPDGEQEGEGGEGDSGPNPPWPLWAAGGMILAGVLVSMGILFTRPIPEIPEPDPNAIEEEEAEIVIMDGVEMRRVSFEWHQRAVESARKGDARIEALLDMVDYLVYRSRGWSESMVRVMAGNYLLAAADMSPSGALRERTTSQLLRLAARWQDKELYARGLAMGAELETSTSDDGLLRLLEWDAALALNDHERALRLLVRAEDVRQEGSPMPVHNQIRVARTLRNLLDSEEGPALWAGKQEDLTDDERADDMRSTLEAVALQLAQRERVEAKAEGWFQLAYLAGQREDVDEQIQLLKNILDAGPSRVSDAAHLALLDLLKGRDKEEEFLYVLNSMLTIPELRGRVVESTIHCLQARCPAAPVNSLLRVVENIIRQSNLRHPPPAQLLLVAAQVALENNLLDQAARYLEELEKQPLSRDTEADALLVRAYIAQRNGKYEDMIRYMTRLLTLHPGHPAEAEVRFALLSQQQEAPFAETDMVGGVIGALIRLPHDPRGREFLKSTANRLEELGLYDIAESFYGRLALLNSMHRVPETSFQSAVSVLGQARAMVAQERYADADALLRVMNSNTAWIEIWPESGPLWAAIAFQLGQPREGVRRWMQTCGAPEDPLLAEVFDVLLPDGDEETVTRVGGQRLRGPDRPPVLLMLPAVQAAVNRLVRNEQFDEVGRLLHLIEQDDYWQRRLPVNRYRTQVLAELSQKDTLEPMEAWLRRFPVLVELADGEVDEVAAWTESIEALQRMIRSVSM